MPRGITTTACLEKYKLPADCDGNRGRGWLSTSVPRIQAICGAVSKNCEAFAAGVQRHVLDTNLYGRILNSVG